MHPVPAGNPLLGFRPKDNLQLSKYTHPGLLTAASSVNAELWDAIRTLGCHLSGAEAQGSGLQSPQILFLGAHTWALPACTYTRLPEPGVWLSEGYELLSEELLSHAGPGPLAFRACPPPSGERASASRTCLVAGALTMRLRLRTRPGAQAARLPRTCWCHLTSPAPCPLALLILWHVLPRAPQTPDVDHLPGLGLSCKSWPEPTTQAKRPVSRCQGKPQIYMRDLADPRCLPNPTSQLWWITNDHKSSDTLLLRGRGLCPLFLSGCDSVHFLGPTLRD